MNIRPARPEDAEQITAIWNPYIRDTAATFNSVEKTAPALRDDIMAKAEAGHAFLVVERDARIAGFGLYGQFRAGVGYAHSMEHTLYLSRQVCGHGAGRALLEALETHARARGAHSMIGGIGSENQGSIAFHAALGYAEVARVPQVGRKFQRWMDLVLMQKML